MANRVKRQVRQMPSAIRPASTGAFTLKENRTLSLKAKVLAILLFLAISTAQAQESASFWDDPFNDPLLPLYLTLAFVAVTILMLIFVVASVLRAFNLIVRLTEQERAAKLGVPYKKQLSWWEKLWNQVNRLSPIENEKDLDTGHDFDGIRELDNHLPPWWKWLFYATIIWGGIYLVVYHVTDSLPLSEGEFQNELAEAERNARALLASQPAEVIDAEALEYVADGEILARGQKVFTSSNCGSCHRNDGGGNAIGPNLTDEYWLHGGSIKNIYSTINKGVVEKGMPAWGKVMSAKDVRDVAFFIMSLKGSNPAGAKVPQGDLYKDEPKKIAPDSTVAQVMSK